MHIVVFNHKGGYNSWQHEEEQAEELHEEEQVDHLPEELLDLLELHDLDLDDQEPEEKKDGNP